MTEQNGVERSSATDELRAELTRRGVEWWLSDDPCCEYIITHWCVEPFQWTAIEGEKDLWLNAGIAGHEPLTPEQAIAATLGDSDATSVRQDVAGTCHDSNRRFNAWQCSECGATLLLMFDDCGEPTYSVGGFADMPRYCPNCGRKVVDE